MLKKYEFIVESLTIFSILPPFLSVRYFGCKLNFIDIIKLISFLLSFVIAVVIACIYAVKVRKLTDRYINHFISQSKIKCPHFSDKLVSEIAYAYQYVTNNLNIMKKKQKCRCINCLTIFSSDEIKEHNSKSVICPYCNKENIIAESSGYPITNEFLSEMKEYWIDSIN